MGHELDAAIERTKDSFTVVIMGNIASGKTTMINAFIGERLLPMAATAVITELHYGENKKIIMYIRRVQTSIGKATGRFRFLQPQRQLKGILRSIMKQVLILSRKIP